MLDACPHHHEEEAAETLAGITLRSPGNSKPLTGKKFWRSLDEITRTKSFEDMLHREFPHAASEWTDEPSRRNFLKLMSASLALAGLTACTLQKPEEKIVPYVDPPENVIPGRPMFYASTMNWCGYGKGVVVESHEGRPTKIEGNPDHPASLGSSDIWMQASVLEMYDPDRSQTVRHGDDLSSWGAFVTAMAGEMKQQAGFKGNGLRFLTGATTSPTVARLMGQLLKLLPEAKWHQYEAVGRRNSRAGAIAAFGTDVETIYHFDQADVVLSLESHFLTECPGSLVYAREFIDRRRVRLSKGEADISRLYAAESCVSLVGAKADHRLAIKSSAIGELLEKITAAVDGTSPTKGDAGEVAWVKAVASDLVKAKGKSLVVVGETQPPAVHAMAHRLNEKLGNGGKTVTYIDPVEAYGPGGPATLEELVRDANADAVHTLFILGANPSYSAPVELGLSAGLTEETADARKEAFEKTNPFSKIPLIVHHGLYNGEKEETPFFATWHVPASHYLEAWGDLRAFDGTASITQPLIFPLYTSKSEAELLSTLVALVRRANGEDVPDLSGYDVVRQTWTNDGPKLSEATWQKALEKGVVPNTAFAAKTVKAGGSDVAVAHGSSTVGYEVVIRPDPVVLDGRVSNLGWLQELPKPITLLTWENAALLSVKTARDLKLHQDDPGRSSEVQKITLKLDETHKITIPALILPGHADDSITVHLGYGRVKCGRVGERIGADVTPLRQTSDTWIVPSVTVEVEREKTMLATAQSHHLIDLPDAEKNKLDSKWLDERELTHSFTVDELDEAKADNTGTVQPKEPYRKVKLDLHPAGQGDKDRLFPDRTNSDVHLHPGPTHDPSYNKWGMVIDAQACIGCNACVIACQAENNIAIVGKEQVIKGREMHWIRIDTYFEGDAEGNPDVYFQPLPCMHCENAPCTLVCPVEATTISDEGINEMTYNRCVGTRYCSNNCPYKVRRFNFMEWTDYETPQFMLQRNPNVTVRSRGVMEKCTYCIQRINNGRIEAKKQDRPIDPGEVVTACAQACPTQAIIFGNLNDDRWEVTKLQNEPLRYTLLDSLNTLPRTSYLSRVKNPNPALGEHEHPTNKEGGPAHA